MLPKLSITQKDRLMVAIAILTILSVPVWLLIRDRVVKAPTGNDRFGLAFISAADQLADEARYGGALTSGARWDRWPLYWHWVAEGGYVGSHEAGREQHDYDTLISQELAQGFTPIVILMGTPEQYSQPSTTIPPDPLHPEEIALLATHVSTESMAISAPSSLFEPIFDDNTDAPGPGKAINPTNAWANFVFETVARYRPGGQFAQQNDWPNEVGIRYWEIWNEPDYAQFWAGSVEEYYRLLEVAYKTIKVADPKATVLLGGLAFYEKHNWFTELLRQTEGYSNRAYFDIFSFHHYLSIYDSENLIRRTRTTLDDLGLAHVPIWITESGVSVWDDYPASTYGVPPNEPLRGTQQEQAAYIIQHSALAFYHEVERYYHFMLHDDCGDGPSSAYGLRQNFSQNKCNPARGDLRPAYAAYQLAAAQFHNIVPLWRDRKPKFDQVAFYRQTDASRVLALWSTTGITATATISATGDLAKLYWVEPVDMVTRTVGLSQTLILTPTLGRYEITLPPATNQNSILPDDPAYQIGGRPYLLIEQDTQPPTATLKALPPTSPENILIQWQGEDHGSGVAGYDIWVSQDHQPLKPWLVGVTLTQTNYTGQFGRSYGFALRARDRAGNEMPRPVQPEVTTQVAVRGVLVSGHILGPNNQAVPEAEIIISGTNTQIRLVSDRRGLWGPVSIPPGEYGFSARAPVFGDWATPRLLIVDSSTDLTLTLSPVKNRVAAADFEGDKVWHVWDWAGQVNLSVDAFDGQFGVRLGDYIGEAIDCAQKGPSGQYWTISQAVIIPTETPFLSFMHKISTTQTASGDAWLEVSFLPDDIDEQEQLLVPPDELWRTTGWQMVALDLSAWAGQSGRIQFRAVRCSEEHSFRVSLDRISIGANSD